MSDDQVPMTPAEKAAAAEQKAAREYQENVRRSNDPEGVPLVALPFGKRVPITRFMDVTNEFKDADRGRLLAEVKKYLKNPSDNVYAWPVKSDPECQAKIRAGEYKPVRKSQLDSSKGFPTHKGPDDYVYWYDHILVEVMPDTARRQYVLPIHLAAMTLARGTEAWKAKVAKTSGGIAAAEVTRSDEQ